ncbi:MAG: radical SAM protein [Nitrospirae bacterium]|nr:radical SAM protein [Nitrospirota bacterium]
MQPRPLAEFNLYRPKPGHPDWPRLAAEAKQLADEILPTLERPRTGRHDLGRKLGSYRTVVRNYLDNRRRAKAGREDLRPLYFIWTTLRSCNFSCTYCDDHQGHKYPDLPNDGVLNTEQGIRLLEIMRTRTPSVYFAGGEPTMRQDLPTLTRAARNLNYYPIIINTNASLIHRWLKKESWKTWLADTDFIVVSLDALDLSLLNDMWIYGRSQDVLRNLLLLRELAEPMNFKLMVNTVIQPGHLQEAGAVLDFANDLGITFCPVPMNIGPTINAALKGDGEYLALADRILERKQQGYPITGSLRMNRRLLHSEPLNCRNTVKPHIDFDGRLVWPCKATVNVKPEYINVLDFKDVDTLYDYAASKVNPTKFHGPACNQCGANCNWAQNYTTDTYFNGLVHPLSMVRDAFEFLS